jgi:hypothetical protein
VIEIDRVNKIVKAQGVFHDLETNVYTSADVSVRISDKNGKLYNEDMIVVTGQAACSKAKRNAILQGVPRPVWDKAYTQIEKIIAGDAKTLTTRRDDAVKAFAMYGVKPEQVFLSLGLGSIEEITLDHIVTLTGFYQSIKSGEATVETVFGNARNAEPNTNVNSAIDAVVAAQNVAQEPVDQPTNNIID